MVSKGYRDSGKMRAMQVALLEQEKMTMALLNCNACMRDMHDECTGNCLCASDNHGKKRENINDILAKAAQDSRYASPENEPREYEKALEDEERLQVLLSTDIGDRDVTSKLIEIATLLIKSEHIVSKIEIEKRLKRYALWYGLNADYDTVIAAVFADADIFECVKRISATLGENDRNIMFSRDQIIEASHYIIGKCRIKRIDVTGTMLFYNGQYYEDSAEALIRRTARKILLKSKNGDMTEIVRMIEDTCPIITWHEIESDAHIKCLLNGTFDIKRGVFSPTFSPDNIILNQIPHNYVDEGNFSVISSKMSQIMPNKNDLQSFYDFVSIVLHPYSGIDFQFGGVGQPGTGKSQTCELLTYLLGEKNVASSPIHSIASDMTTQKDVAFKFLNIDMDMSSETIKNIDVLKRWITQDKFTARGIYEHNTTFRPMARLCFMANDLYEIANSDDADAIYERTHIIQMNQKFRGTDKVIRNLMKTIATDEELDQMISYLLRNSHWIWENKNIHHPMLPKAVQDTWNIFGNRIKEFIGKWIVKGVDHRAPQDQVWDKWLSFANKHDYHAKDKKKFKAIFDELMGSAPTKTRIDGEQVWAYSGFRLYTDEEMKKFEQSALFEKSFLELSVPKAPKATIFFTLRKTFENHKNKNKINEKLTELLELVEDD